MLEYGKPLLLQGVRACLNQEDSFEQKKVVVVANKDCFFSGLSPRSFLNSLLRNNAET